MEGTSQNQELQFEDKDQIEEILPIDQSQEQKIEIKKEEVVELPVVEALFEEEVKEEEKKAERGLRAGEATFSFMPPEFQRNFYSNYSIFGYDNQNWYREYMIKNNFHAKLLNQLDEDLRFNEQLDVHFRQIILANKNPIRLETTKRRKLAHMNSAGQEEMMVSEREKTETNLELKRLELEELSSRIDEQIMSNLPPQEGGVDYKKQHSLIELANMTILDEIKRLEKSVQGYKKELEQEGVNINDLNRRRAYFQQYVEYQGVLPGQNYFGPREDSENYGGSSLTKQHLLQLNRQNQHNPFQYGFRMGQRRSSISSSQQKAEMMCGESFSSGNPYGDRRKRYRRTANEIERRFKCFCGKAYGSEGSLNQHKKLKGHHYMHNANM